MKHYRRTTHTRFNIKPHLVWITKYRKKLLRGDVGFRLCQIVRTICAELEAEILKGHVSQDYVHPFVFCPSHVLASYLMQRVEEEELTNPTPGVQPSEQGMLGESPVGEGVLRSELW